MFIKLDFVTRKIYFHVSRVLASEIGYASVTTLKGMSRSSDLIERHWDITSKLAEMIEFLLLQFNDIPFPKSVAEGTRSCAKGGGGGVGGWV